MINEAMPLLAICIPTRNGGDTVINNVRNILRCKDRRFIVHVNNNDSTDDTLSRLQEIAEQDDRLKITSNDHCVLAYENFNNVLLRAEAIYEYIIIDKETLETRYLVDFLNLLETTKPYFGYVNYRRRYKVGKVLIRKRGVDAIKNISHFGNTHTTGFFYKKELYGKYNELLMNHTNGGNWWITDLTSLCLGFDYDGVTYNLPLNIFNYQAVLGGISKSKFTKENLYFFGKQRCVDYKMFLELILLKEKSKKVIPVIKELNKRYINLVTYDQRRYFNDKQRCLHYGAETREVSYSEMKYWCKELYNILSDICRLNNVKTPKFSFCFASIIAIAKSYLSERFLVKQVNRSIVYIKRLYKN